MDWVTWINTCVGVIGIIVGIIGLISLHEAKIIKNTIKSSDGAMIINTEVYNQGVSEDTVRLIASDMTKEELCQLVIRLIPIYTDDENCVGNRLRRGDVTADQFDEILENIPTTYYGKTKPPGFPYMKDGDIYCEIE